MKICHVNLACGCNDSDRQILQLIKQQLREGYDFIVVMNPKSELIQEVRKLGCKVVLAKHFTKAHSKKITQDCTAIHAHEKRAIYWALIQHLLYGVPYLITHRVDNLLSKQWLLSLAYNKAAALVGLNREMVLKIEEIYHHSKVYRIPSSPINYPIDQNKVDQIWNQFRGKFIVIHSAEMMKNKGFDDTVSAAKLLGVSNPRVQFLLLGDGPEREALEHEARGLTNVSFMGKQRDIGTWFASADLLIHPAYSENTGTVILEAIRAGLPIIGYDTGAIPDIIDHEISGLLSEPGNTKQLAKQINQLENNRSLRRKIQMGGKEKLKQFDIVYTSSLYKEIYTQISQTSLNQ